MLRSLTVLAAVTAVTGSVLAGSAAQAASPGAATARVAVTRPAPGAAASRCLVWWKKTDNYEGWTAGYSWAWNVTVSEGATGDRVREIQCLTDLWVGRPRDLDGVFGSDTREAVQETQALLGASTDGVVGPDTWRRMRTTPHTT